MSNAKKRLMDIRFEAYLIGDENWKEIKLAPRIYVKRSPQKDWGPKWKSEKRYAQSVR